MRNFEKSGAGVVVVGGSEYAVDFDIKTVPDGMHRKIRCILSNYPGELFGVLSVAMGPAVLRIQGGSKSIPVMAESMQLGSPILFHINYSDIPKDLIN